MDSQKFYIDALDLIQLGKTEEALIFLKSQLKESPEDFSIYSILGLAYLNLNNFDESIRMFKEAINLGGDLFQSLFYIAIAYQKLESYHESIEYLYKAKKINPIDADVDFNLGIAFGKIDEIEKALACYSEAIDKNPEHFYALNNRGIIFLDKNQFLRAKNDFNSALKINPAFIQANINYIKYFIEIKDFQAAIKTVNQFEKSGLNSVDLIFLRGYSFFEIFYFQDAYKDMQNCIQLDKDYDKAYYVMARINLYKNEFQMAEKNIEVAIEKNPKSSDALHAAGLIAYTQKKLKIAKNYFDRCLSLDKNHIHANFSRSLIYLYEGDYLKGWKHYESRLKMRPELIGPIKENYGKRWTGEENIANKKIIVISEQGHGDIIQFFRYINLIKDKSAKITLKTNAALISLLSKSCKEIEVLENSKDEDSYDYYIPIMSLPLAFKSSLESIPKSIPYIHVDREKINFWIEKIGDTKRINVGLIWSGGFRPDSPDLWPTNDRRNIPLNMFEGFKKIDVNFYSFQKGQPAEFELDRLVKNNWDGPEIKNLTSELYDFEDTAAFLSCIDLLITVDTSTAHIAGAIGKKVWLLNRYDSCWRWLDNRSDSPWYPSMKIFNQPKLNDWESVIDEVCVELKKIVSSNLS